MPKKNNFVWLIEHFHLLVAGDRFYAEDISCILGIIECQYNNSNLDNNNDALINILRFC